MRRELHTEWHPTGIKQLEGWLVDGRREGVWSSWNAAGFKAWEAHYVRGQLQGTYTCWDNGRVAWEIDFVADDMRRRRVYEPTNGRDNRNVLTSEESFRCGRRDGPARYPRGGRSETRYFSNGETIPDPSVNATSRAAGYWVKHAETAAGRVEAARQLAGYQPLDAMAIEDLMAGLSDPEAQVVRECVIVLGIAGALAEPAMKLLERLVQDGDRALAECARKALQQIRGAGKAAK